MSVFQDNGVILGITADGEELTVTDKVDILSGSAVTVTIKPEMKDKVLLFYRDENGILHNLFPKVSADGKTVTFNMPFRTCELHVTNQFELLLNLYDIVFPAGGGFRTELVFTNEDRGFDYAGDILITRNDKDINGNLLTTYISNYRLRFEDNFSNSDGRRIILKKLHLNMQTGFDIDLTLYIDGSDGGKVYFSGGERQYFFDGNLTFRGLNGKDTDLLELGNYVFWGGMDKFAFENLHLISKGLIYPNTSAGAVPAGVAGYLKEAFFENCKLEFTDGNVFHSRAERAKAYFTNCDILLTGNACFNVGNNNTVLHDAIYITLTDCNVVCSSSKLMRMGVLVLDNTVITSPGAPTQSQLNDTIRLLSLTLKNGSKLYSPNSILAETLTLTGGSVIYSGYDPITQTSSGRLSGYNFTVEQGSKAYAKYVLTAGVIDHNSASTLWSALVDAGKYSGIVIDGGYIYATEFIGSDLNGKITVTNGGYLEAKYIGTYGKIFNAGYIDDKFPFFYPNEPTVQKSVINITNGSTVKILDGGYLGGADSTVYINNSTVDGAAGDISGGLIEISGTASKIYVANIISDDGEIIITDANGAHFDNAYIYNDRKHDKVAIYVTNNLRAHKITIDNGALIFAYNAYSYALEGEENGSFTITPNCGAELYTQSYGYIGGGDHTLVFIPNNEGNNQNIWGTVTVAIRYNYGNLFGESDEFIVNNNPTYFIYTYGEVINLEALEHPYLEFAGWVDAQGRPAPTVNKALIPNGNVVERIATWKLKTVQFEVIINGEVFSSDVNIADEVDLSQGTLEGNIFKWHPLTGEYTGRLWGSQTASENLFKFEEHSLHTHTITLVGVYTPDGTRLFGDSITREMLDAYADGANGPLQIRVISVSKTALNLIFHLNIKDGKPADAHFNGTTDKEVVIYANVGVIFNSASKSELVDELTDLSAKGYNFLGWSSDPNADPSSSFVSDFNALGIVGSDIMLRDWYAVWQPKEYYVTFYPHPENPGDGKYYVTAGDAKPEADAEENRASINVYLKYDQIIDREHIIPTVWQEGQVFNSWYYIDTYAGENTPVYISITEVFNLLNPHFSHIDFDNADNTQALLTFYADFDPLNITYETNGGKFQDGVYSEQPEAPNTPLRGYVSLAGGLPANGEYVHSFTASAWGLVSTKADYFNANKDYIAEDYRKVGLLTRSGYTFNGWYSDPECTQPIEVTERFYTAHITVYAKWTANSYQVTLNASHGSYTSGAQFTLKNGDSYTDNAAGAVNVWLTVGELIADSSWPSRDAWGTRQNAQVSTPRPLWGFAFNPMDPWYPGANGSDAANNYIAYNNAIKELNNNGELFVKNINRFALPEGLDYPQGSSLQMYAVYNDYAIVFMQYYLDRDGNPTQKVIDTVTYGAINAYDLQKLKEIEINLPGEGYTPLGWYVNSTVLNPNREYAVGDFINQSGEKFLSYKAEALTTTFDIIVYHIYAVDEKKDGLEFTTDPIAQTKADGDIASYRIQELTVPANMQPGMLLYTFKNPNYSDIYAVTDPSTGAVTRDYTAAPYGGALGFADSLSPYAFDKANTVALEIKVYRGGALENTVYLNGNTGAANIEVRPNDKLVITVYHSYVITEASDNLFDLSFTFNDSEGNAIHGQQLLLNDVKLALQPAQYKVVFHAGSDGKTVNSSGSFTDGDTVEVSGDALTVFTAISQMPSFIGYDHLTSVEGAQQWHEDSSGAVVTVKNGAVSISGMPSYNADGVLHLYAKWEAVLRYFEVEDPETGISILDYWKVEYLNADGVWVEITDSNKKEVAYDSQIRFSPKSGTPNPGFVKLNIGAGEPKRLELDIPQNGTFYEWKMPDADVKVVYSDVLDLFLDNGNIILTPNRFYQDKVGGTWLEWEGKYLIRQNILDDTSIPTTNTLTVNGNMSGKLIMLGALNISGENSISLDKYSDAYMNIPNAPASSVGTNVTLTLSAPNVTVANILVPQGGILTVVGENASNMLTLIPMNGASAIGQASGAYNSRITISNCTVTVEETGEYVGIWFGGINTESVTLENVTLIQPAAENGIAGRYVIYANTATITGSALGTDSERIAEPIYAVSTLTFTDSTVYMQPTVPQAAISMIGTGSAGTMEIYGNTVIDIKYNGTFRSNNPFTGTMKLNSQDARVVIDNMLVLDTRYGDITINEAEVVQGSKTQSHSGNYIILQEFDTSSVALSVNAAKTVIFVQPQSGELYINAFTVADALRLLSQANAAGNALALNIESVSIAAGAELNMSLSDSDIIKLGGFVSSYGTYRQTNGTLSSSADLIGRDMDIMLDGVTVNALSLVAKNLNLVDCAVTASNSVGSYGVENGMTTVTISGGTVTASTVGALGEKKTTFTMVDIIGDVYVSGTLIRDIYAIVFNYQSGYNLPNDMETVLRTTQVLDGTAPVPLPTEDTNRALLGRPTVDEGKVNKFVTWYLRNASEKISLYEQADFLPEHWTKYKDKFGTYQNGLGYTDVQYAVIGENDIPTVTVYAFYTISGTVGLTQDQLFEAFIGSDNIAVSSDRGWSAFFTVESTREDGEDYAVIFNKAQPKGTKLILVWLGRTNEPMYYYYEMDGTETTVLFSQFKALGTEETLLLTASTVERHSFILTVDYTYVTNESGASADYTVGLGYKTDPTASVEELCRAAVTVNPADEDTTLTVTDNAVELQMPNNDLYSSNSDGNAYGYAILVKADKKLPYTAIPKLSYTADNGTLIEVQGQLIGGDMILFVLGEYKQNIHTEFTASDLTEGYVYEWSAVLLKDSSQVNVFKTLESN